MVDFGGVLGLFGALRRAAGVVYQSLGPLVRGRGARMRRRGCDGEFFPVMA